MAKHTDDGSGFRNSLFATDFANTVG
jgi:hypothetical protein